MRHTFIFAITAATLAATAPTAASATSVLANTSAAQLIGSIAAGQAYTITATGTVQLCGSCNSGGPLTFNPNGTIANTATGSYAPFNSGPLDHDPSSSPSSSSYYGFYGPGVYLGGLYGSFTATPTGSADLFLIGSSYTISAGAARTLYAIVNDSYYGDNPVSSFNVTLNSAAATPAVPEPATWATMLLGMGAIAGVARYRRRSTRLVLA